MNYIVTVKWGDGHTKKYLVGATSQRGAIREFRKLWGYDPGVPMDALPAGTFRADEVIVLESR